MDGKSQVNNEVESPPGSWEDLEIWIRVVFGLAILKITYTAFVRPALWLLIMARPGFGEYHSRLAMYDMECRYGGKKNAEMVLGFGEYLAQADQDEARQKRLETAYGAYVPPPDPNDPAFRRRFPIHHIMGSDSK